MNAIAGIVIALGLVMSPIIMLQTMVMPQLNEMKNFYSTMDQTVQKVADGATVSNGQTVQTKIQY